MMRVALVHDWLTGLRGGEKVLEVLCELFPRATLFTLVHVEGATSPIIESLPIRTAFTQKLPAARKLYRWYLPLHPWAIESLNLEGFDLVISSSHCVAKGVRPPSGALHICYCHTPMRYVWDRFEDYFGTGLKARFLYGPVAKRLREWDVRSASRVHEFIANSSYVAGRIESYYHRKADAVIPPPVDTDFYVLGSGEPGPYYLVVSALVPYKRIDLAIDAFRNRSEELVIVGAGPSEARLRAGAPDNVRFTAGSGTNGCVSSTRNAGPVSCRESRTSGSFPSKPKPAVRLSSPSVKAAPSIPSATARPEYSSKRRLPRLFRAPLTRFLRYD